MIASSSIEIATIDPTYSRSYPNNLEFFDQLSFRKHISYEPQTFAIIKISPKGFGGNHYHSRIESFVAMGATLELIYIEDGASKSIILNPDGLTQVVTILPNIPHAIVNQSLSQVGVLLECGDKPMTDRIDVDVYNPY